MIGLADPSQQETKMEGEREENKGQGGGSPGEDTLELCMLSRNNGEMEDPLTNPLDI